MSDQTNTENDAQADEQQVDELTLLKQRARMMGVQFSNNIGLEALKERIQAKIAEAESITAATSSASSADPTDPSAPAPKTRTLRQMLYEENMRLVRLRITNLDPKKKDLPGEIITVGNDHLGTVRKYVPFGEVTDNGYHVPYCIYKAMKARKFLNIRTFKDRKNGNQIRVEQNMAQEFALEVLDPLTPQELQQLAAAQAAAGNMN